MSRSPEVVAAIALLDERDALLAQLTALRAEAAGLRERLAQAEHGAKTAYAVAERCQRERDAALAKQQEMAAHPDVIAAAKVRRQAEVSQLRDRLAALEREGP